MVIVVLGIYSFLWYHDAQQNALIFLKQSSLFGVFESKVLDEIELDRYVSSVEDVTHGL